MDIEQHWKCNMCLKYKPINEYRRKMPGCAICRRETKKQYTATLVGHIKALLSHAKHHTIARKNTKSRTANGVTDEFNLTFNDAIEILKKQRGLCYYSNIKMNYGSVLDKNWVCSLERIDSTKGYTKNNV